MTLCGKNRGVMLSAGNLFYHDVEAARARNLDIIRPLFHGTSLVLLEILKLRVNSKLTKLVFTPYEYLRALNVRWWLHGVSLLLLDYGWVLMNICLSSLFS